MSIESQEINASEGYEPGAKMITSVLCGLLSVYNILNTPTNLHF